MCVETLFQLLRPLKLTRFLRPGLDEKERRGMLGLPLSLQVVTPNYTDERCLAIAALIDEIVKQ